MNFDFLKRNANFLSDLYLGQIIPITPSQIRPNAPTKVKCFIWLAILIIIH